MDIDVIKLNNRNEILGAISVVMGLINAQNASRITANDAPPVQIQPLSVGEAHIHRIHRNNPVMGILQ